MRISAWLGGAYYLEVSVTRLPRECQLFDRLQITTGCMSRYMHISDLTGVFSASPVNGLGHVLLRERNWLFRSRSKGWPDKV